VIVLFHGLFRDRRDVASGVCDPQQGITAGFFAQFLEALLAQDITVRELGEAFQNPRPGLTAVITFDDGYVNNAHALPALEQFRVPATFFISTRHVQEQKSFWWDAVYREGVKRKETVAAIRRRVRSLKALKAAEIEARVKDWFGTHALKPMSDADRPFTASELAQFARSPFVFLGNHTGDHAILVNYDPEGIRQQIDEAQQFLAGIIGTAPRSIAYPNGNCDARVTEIARAAGLELGLTVRAGVNHAPTQDPMMLRRLTIWNVPGAAGQAWFLTKCATAHSPKKR
jgi:peptidoglycan/xylan/chitin deacetylase (PgdA/CDA1 family)